MPGGTSQDLPPVSPKTKKYNHYQKLQVCSNFISGNCNLGENCSLPHPDPSVVVDNNSVTICYDNLKGLCDRENCKYYHPTEKVKEKMETFGTKMSPSVMWNKTNVSLSINLMYTCVRGSQFRRLTREHPVTYVCVYTCIQTILTYVYYAYNVCAHHC